MYRKIKVAVGIVLDKKKIDHVDRVGARRAVPCCVHPQFFLPLYSLRLYHNGIAFVVFFVVVALLMVYKA